MATEESKLENFGKHIPGILRRQIITKLTQHYIQRQQEGEDKSYDTLPLTRPSIERFHCALLFVDISGFTILSQRLNVDELRLHINAYFKKILDIVEKHGGEAIKFAGDALFIIWQTKSTVIDPKSPAALVAIKSAVECGLEINVECSNYEIKLQPLHTYKGGGIVASAQDITPFAQTTEKMEMSYLNVHSGVSMGLMAGIDVTANDRSEYLLIGDPLGEVSQAESVAKAGDLVISPQAHAILHPMSEQETQQLKSRAPSFSFAGGDVGTSSKKSRIRSSFNAVLAAQAMNKVAASFSNQSGTSNSSSTNLKDTDSTPPPLSCGCEIMCENHYFKIKNYLLCKDSFSQEGFDQFNQSTSSASALALENKNKRDFFSESGSSFRNTPSHSYDVNGFNLMRQGSIDEDEMSDHLRLSDDNSQSSSPIKDQYLSHSQKSVDSPSNSTVMTLQHSTIMEGNEVTNSVTEQTIKETASAFDSVKGYIKSKYGMELHRIAVTNNNRNNVSSIAHTKSVAHAMHAHSNGATASFAHNNPSFSVSGMNSPGSPNLASFTIDENHSSESNYNLKAVTKHNANQQHSAQQNTIPNVSSNGNIAGTDLSVEINNEEMEQITNLSSMLSPISQTAGNSHPTSPSDVSSPNAFRTPRHTPPHDVTSPPGIGAMSPVMGHVSGGANMLDAITDNFLSDHYTEWIQPCLLDDIARHVHEASRTDYFFANSVRTNVLYDHIHNQSLITRSIRKHTRGGITVHNESLVKKLRNEIFTSNSVINNSKHYSGELRSIIVMFINIDMKDNNTLFVDTTPDVKVISPPSSHHSSGASFSAAAAAIERMVETNGITMHSRLSSVSSVPSGNNSTMSSFAIGTNNKPNDGIEDINNPAFYFLKRTALERKHDEELCSRFQQCMEIMAKAFSTQGGQMRQFIVDDKGTVCIGTFGLKGAVNNDNAAAALGAGQSIILELNKIGLNASIGVTSGKAYCGNVGSPTRHEFAVMGASTCLSARLMCKAKPLELICDEEVKVRDRTHTFIPLGTVPAKGYTKPVPVFRPLFEHFKAMMQQQAELANAENGGEGGTGLQMSTASSNNSKGTISKSKQKLLRAITKLSTFLQLSQGLINHNNNLRAMQGRHAETQDFLSFILPAELDVTETLTKQFLSIDITVSANSAHNIQNKRQKVIDNTTTLNSIALLETFSQLPDNIFDITAKAKFIVLEGVNGIGKSQFMESIIHKIVALSMLARAKCNIAIYSNHATSFNKSILFHIWKNILIELFLELGHSYMKAHNIVLDKTTLYTTHSRKAQSPVNNASKKTTASTSEDNRRIAIDYGINHMFEHLSPDIQVYKPLLYFLHVLEEDPNKPEPDRYSKLGSYITHSVDLICAIIQAFPIVSGKIIMLYISDIEFIDSLSLQVLQSIWMNNTGVIIFASCRSINSHNTTSIDAAQQHSNPNDLQQHVVSLPLYRMFETMAENNDKKRYLKIELGPLSLEDTKCLVCDIFKIPIESVSSSSTLSASTKNLANSTKYSGSFSAKKSSFSAKVSRDGSVSGFDTTDGVSDDSIFVRIFTMSGGNPLYAVEIAKAMVNQLEITNTTNLDEGNLSNKVENFKPGEGLVIETTSSKDESIKHEMIQRELSGNPLDVNNTAEKLLQLSKGLLGVDFHINRIDEIICYRFDQLDSVSQYFLKVASVACSYSKVFTLAMITSMMQEGVSSNGKNGSSDLHRQDVDRRGVRTAQQSRTHDTGATALVLSSHAAALDIAYILFSILKSNEFIRVTTASRISAYQSSSQSSASETQPTPGKPQQEANNAAAGSVINTAVLTRASSERIGAISRQDSGRRDSSANSNNAPHRVSAVELGHFDATTLGKYEFEFRVELEQITIYELMLNDQKQFLHMKCANFLSQLKSKRDATEAANVSQNMPVNLPNNALAYVANSPNTVAELYEEGYHWKLAAKWSNAMCCYYRSSMLLEHLGAHQDKISHLYLAYNCLNSLRVESGVKIDENYKGLDFPALFKQQVEHTEAKSNAPHIGHSKHGGQTSHRQHDAEKTYRNNANSTDEHERSHKTHTTTTKHHNFAQIVKPPTKFLSEMRRSDVYRIFRGDAELLEVGLNILMRLGRAVTDITITSRLFDEAIQLIMLVSATAPIAQISPAISGSHSTSIGGGTNNVGTPVKGQQAHLTTANVEKLSIPTVDSNDNITTAVATVTVATPAKEAVSKGRTKFGLRNPKVVFPILSSIILMFKMHTLPDDAERTKESAIVKLFLSIATSNQEEFQSFYLVGLCLLRTLQCDQQKFNDMLITANEIRTTYDVMTHGRELIHYYVFDLVPHTMVTNIQALAFMGRVAELKTNIDSVHNVLRNLRHLNSLALTSLSLLSTLIAYGNRHMANRICQQFIAYEASSGTSSMFHDMFILYKEWSISTIVFDECIDGSSVLPFKNPAYATRSAPYVSHIKRDLVAIHTHANAGKTRTTLNYDFTLFTNTLNESLMNVIMSDTYIQLHKNRQYMYNHITYFSPEYVCACLCLLKAKTMFVYLPIPISEHDTAVTVSANVSAKAKFVPQLYDVKRISTEKTVSQKDSIRVYLDKANEYNNMVIENCSKTLFYSYAYITALFLKAEILMFYSKIQINNELQSIEYCEQSIDVLKSIYKLCDSVNLHFIVLLVGACLEMWHLDVNYGVSIQEKAVKDLITLNGQELTDSLLVGVLRTYPVLNKHIKNMNVETITDMHI